MPLSVSCDDFCQLLGAEQPFFTMVRHGYLPLVQLLSSCSEKLCRSNRPLKIDSI